MGKFSFNFSIKVTDFNFVFQFPDTVTVMPPLCTMPPVIMCMNPPPLAKSAQVKVSVMPATRPPYTPAVRAIHRTPRMADTHIVCTRMPVKYFRLLSGTRV